MNIENRIKRILDIGSSILVTVAAVALLWTLYKLNAGTGPVAAGARVEAVEGLIIDATKVTKRIGTGTVALVEFSDFQCPYCGRHARDTFPSLRKKLIDTGKLTYVTFAFPLEGIHPLARKASEAAECAARQGRYWEMYERLFAQPSDLSITTLVRNASELGLDSSRFTTCLSGEASNIVASDIDQGHRLNVQSTPTFFLGRFQTDGSIQLVKKINGMVPTEALENAVSDISKKS